MMLDNILAIDTGLLSKESLDTIRATGQVGKTVWFAHINDDQVAYAVFNNDGSANQIQCVPCATGKVLIARRSFLEKALTIKDYNLMRSGRNVLVIPFSTQDPIVAGAPAEREVYFIDRETMRVLVVIY